MADVYNISGKDIFMGTVNFIMGVNQMNKLSRFISYYKPYRVLFFLDMLCSFTAAGIDLLFPVLVRYLLNHGLSEEMGVAFDIILKIGALMLALHILKYFCQYFITSWGHIMGAKIEYDMREDIFSHLQKLSFSFYDNNKTGQIMSRIVNDLFDITELAHHGPEEVFISLIKIIGSFLILLSINVKLTLITFAFIPLMLAFAFFYNKKMRSVFSRNKQKIAEINSQIEDSIAGIRVVQSFSNEKEEQEKFTIGNKGFFDTKKESYYYMGRFFSGIEFFDGIIYIIAVIVGAYFVKLGTVATSDIVAYLLYINTFLLPIRSLIHFTEQFQKGMTGFERFWKLWILSRI